MRETMTVSREVSWDMGHRVPNHKSKCRNVHGHRYLMWVTLEGEVIGQSGVSDEGMVIDFSDIKTIVEGYIDEKLDHGYMGNKALDREMLELLSRNGMKHVGVDFIPTAENIAKYLFEELSPLFVDAYGTKLRLSEIRLYETPKSYVIYAPEAS